MACGVSLSVLPCQGLLTAAGAPLMGEGSGSELSHFHTPGPRGPLHWEPILLTPVGAPHCPNGV